MNQSQNMPGPSHQQSYQQQHPQGVTDDVTKLIRLLRGFLAFCQKENPSLIPNLIKINEVCLYQLYDFDNSF